MGFCTQLCREPGFKQLTPVDISYQPGCLLAVVTARFALQGKETGACRNVRFSSQVWSIGEQHKLAWSFQGLHGIATELLARQLHWGRIPIASAEDCKSL